MRYKCHLEYERRPFSKISLVAIILLLTLLPIAWSEMIWPNPYMAMIGVAIALAVLVLMLIEMRK